MESEALNKALAEIDELKRREADRDVADRERRRRRRLFGVTATVGVLGIIAYMLLGYALTVALETVMGPAYTPEQAEAYYALPIDLPSTIAGIVSVFACIAVSYLLGWRHGDERRFSVARGE